MRPLAAESSAAVRAVMNVAMFAACAAARCEPYCRHPCHELTGDVADECGGCDADGHNECHPSALGFPAAALVGSSAYDVDWDVSAVLPLSLQNISDRSCDILNEQNGARCKYRALLHDGTRAFIKAVFLPAPPWALDRLHSECNILERLDSAGVGRVPRCLQYCDASSGCDSASVLVQSAVVGARTLDAFSEEPHGLLGLSSVARGVLHLLVNLSRAGVAHRDLSGANILVGEADAADVHLVDFDGAVSVHECAAAAAATGADGMWACAPFHLMPAPPWDASSEPITFNIPPDAFGACTRMDELADELPHAATIDAHGVSSSGAMSTDEVSPFVANSFDLWGLGMALLHKLPCDQNATGRVWHHGLESWRTSQRRRGMPTRDTGADAEWLPALVGNECLDAAPRNLRWLLGRLLHPQAARRGSAGELLARLLPTRDSTEHKAR